MIGDARIAIMSHTAFIITLARGTCFPSPIHLFSGQFFFPKKHKHSMYKVKSFHGETAIYRIFMTIACF